MPAVAVTLTRVLIFCSFAVAPFRGQALAALPTLKTVRQVLELSRTEAAKGYPVQIKAVATYYGPAIPDEHGSQPPPDLFVVDGTGGVWVHLQDVNSPVAVGDVDRNYRRQ